MKKYTNIGTTNFKIEKMRRKQMDIKNCPFCGSVPEERFGKPGGINEFRHRYHACSNMSCIAYTIMITPENLDSWNSRKGLFLSKAELDSLIEQAIKQAKQKMLEKGKFKDIGHP